jgi:hypothetical protein
MALYKRLLVVGPCCVDMGASWESVVHACDGRTPLGIGADSITVVMTTAEGIVIVESGTVDRDGARLACGGCEEDEGRLEERGSIADLLQDKVLLNGEILYVCSDQVQETTER